MVFQGVGDVNESDVFLAATAKAEIIGFNVRIPAAVAKLAKTEKVKIKSYNIIYELLEDLQKQVAEAEVSEEILGEAEIIAEFEIKKERIAGCRMKKGRINKNDKIRLKRGKEILGDLKINSMKHKKQDITEAKKGEEFGVVFTPSIDFKVGDVIIAYKTNQEENESRS